MLYQFVLEVKHVTVSLTKKKTKKRYFSQSLPTLTQYLTQHLHIIGNTTSEMSNSISYYNKLHESVKKNQQRSEKSTICYLITWPDAWFK